jgi:hypothetical protein
MDNQPEYDGLKFLESSTLSKSLHAEAERVRLKLQDLIESLLPDQCFTLEYHSAQHIDWQYILRITMPDQSKYVGLSPCMDGLRGSYRQEFIELVARSLVEHFRYTLNATPTHRQP